MLNLFVVGSIVSMFISISYGIGLNPIAIRCISYMKRGFISRAALRRYLQYQAEISLYLVFVSFVCFFAAILFAVI